MIDLVRRLYYKGAIGMNIYKVKYVLNGFFEVYIAAADKAEAKSEMLKILPDARRISSELIKRNATAEGIEAYCINR